MEEEPSKKQWDYLPDEDDGIAVLDGNSVDKNQVGTFCKQLM
jgi:hypothetical protein